VPGRTQEEEYDNVKSIALIIALPLMFLLTACAEDKPGVVNSVDGPEITKAVGKCNLANSWSISVDPDGHENESIDARAKYRYRVCMSEKQAKQYKSGDRYPKGK
jgi:hypothetical protein